MPGVRRMSTADAVRTIVLGVGLFNLLLYQQELLQAAGPGVARVDLLWAEQHPAEPPSAAPPVPSYKLGLPPGVPPAAAYGLLPRQGGAGETPVPAPPPPPPPREMSRPVVENLSSAGGLRYRDLAQFRVPRSELPMRSAYSSATVVPEAPWYDPAGGCLETCCYRRVAISLGQDEHRLKTTVDSVDLADVRLHGHSLPDHLKFHAAVLTHGIVPCLQDGTIVHVDSYGHSIFPFFNDYRPNMTHTYLLFTTETDGPTPISKARTNLTDPQMIRWYGNNPNPKDEYEGIEKFVGFPLGLSKYHSQLPHLTRYLEERRRLGQNPNPFADRSRWTESADLFDEGNRETTDVLFVKFGINRHSGHRQVPFDSACQNRTRPARDNVTCTLGDREVGMHETYAAASGYLFGLSPPGNGVDCFRNYEFWALGVIPVVVDQLSFFEKGMWADLPVVRLSSWVFTQEELLGKLREYVRSEEYASLDLDRGWERLHLKYWRRKVLEEAGREVVTDGEGNEYYLAWNYTEMQQ